jgi:hypothetical protein
MRCGWNGSSELQMLCGGEAFRLNLLPLTTHCKGFWNAYGTWSQRGEGEEGETGGKRQGGGGKTRGRGGFTHQHNESVRVPGYVAMARESV